MSDLTPQPPIADRLAIAPEHPAEACRVPLDSGRMIAGPTNTQNGDGCHWLAVYDTNGHLLRRATVERWQTDPVGEMTRIAAAVTDGRPHHEGLPATQHGDGTLDYGRESGALITQTGCAVRWPAAPAVCDYVRVTAPDGSEIAYWVCDEWRENPEEVLGALLGACAGPHHPPAAAAVRARAA
jgi:hypothetical protein